MKYFKGDKAYSYKAKERDLEAMTAFAETGYTKSEAENVSAIPSIDAEDAKRDTIPFEIIPAHNVTSFNT